MVLEGPVHAVPGGGEEVVVVGDPSHHAAVFEPLASVDAVDVGKEAVC